MKSLSLTGALGAIVASSASANLRITEAMSSSNGLGTPTVDWIEVTNYGSSAIDITGWKMDDNSFNYAVAVSLSGITSINAGESVIFIESAAGALIPSFNTFWSNSAVRVGYYSGSGVGLSSAGDGVALFNAGGTLMTQVSFGLATSGSSFYWGYDLSGVVNPAYNGLVSTAGTIDTQITASANGDTASLGTVIGVPAPGALALLGLAGITARRRR